MAAIGGALSELTKPYNWEQVGSMTPEEAAELMSSILLGYYNSSCEGEEVETPYWDDASSSDDQAEPETQAWYGNIFEGEFHEVLENWIIAGFIAYSGDLGAALFFLTIAPKFRLAWKTGDVGGIIRVIIDGADYGTVDTYSPTPGILEKDFIADPEVTNHSVLQFLEAFHA